MTTVYQKLSSVPFLKNNYAYKFLFVAFLGIHVPLIGLLLYAIGTPQELSMWQTVSIVLVFTLLGTGVTLWVLKKLLKPVDLAKESLLKYVATKELPVLPTHYTDEVGLLLAGLQKAVETLDAAEKNQADLIALLSHDLRSPFVSILGLAQVIKLEQQKSEIDSMCDMMMQASNQQLQFIDEVTKLYKTENLLLNKTPENIADLVTVVLNENKSAIQLKKLTVNVNIPHELVVPVDLILAKQVIANLVVNAIKFSNPEGQVKLHGVVSNGLFKLTIQDKGMGMDTDIQRELFSHIVRVGRKGTQGESTSGLGLYLCAKIMQKHKGKIEVFSEGAGKGSIFTLTFPQ